MKIPLKARLLAWFFRAPPALGSSLLCLLVGSQLQALDFTYTNTGGAITITGYTGPGGDVDIPGMIEALPVTAIAGGAFWGAGLTRVTIPDTVVELLDGQGSKGGPVGSFFYCSALANVSFGNGLRRIGGGAFNGCASLTKVCIPSNVTNIAACAFLNCCNLTNVVAGSNLVVLGDSGTLSLAFGYCTNLTTLYFQGNAPPSAFNFTGCDKLTIYYLPGTSGWGPVLDGRPTALWNPQADASDSSFGVRQNKFGFNIRGTAGIPLTVEASTAHSASPWTPLQTCLLTNGVVYFSDPQWTNFPERFYRIRSP